MILSSQNSYFKNMFEFEGAKDSFEMHEYEFEPFRDLITFLEDRKLRFNLKNLVSLMDLAQELFVSDLIQLVEK